MTRLSTRFAPLKHAALVLGVLFGAGCNDAAAELPSLQNLPVVEGTEACEWEGPGDNAVCRVTRQLRTTSALEYPLLMQSQGWQKVTPGYGPPLGEIGVFHGDVLWFERPIDASCSERATMQMLPPAPPPDNARASGHRGGLVILIQSDYESVCGPERQAQ